jgi:hypothetical protein
MPTYEVKSRTTGPTTVSTVEADTRELAIHQTLQGCEEGSTMEVMQVTEMPPDVEAVPQARKEK